MRKSIDTEKWIENENTKELENITKQIEEFKKKKSILQRQKEQYLMINSIDTKKWNENENTEKLEFITKQIEELEKARNNLIMQIKKEIKKEQHNLNELTHSTTINNNRKLDSNKYQILESLGSKKNVFKVYATDSAKVMARKIIANECLVKNEVSILSSINKNHKKDHRFLEIYDVLFDDSSKTYCIHMEPGEINLGEILEKRQTYQLAEALYIFRSLVEDLLILQQLGIAHRDIKLENIVLVAKDQNLSYFYYKISDFDIAFELKKDMKSEINIKEMNGLTEEYASPEVKLIDAKKYKFSKYDIFKADVYSLAILVLKLLGLNKEDFISQPIYKKHTLYKIIVEMTKENPTERINFSAVKNFLDNFNLEFTQPNEKECLKSHLKGKTNNNNNDEKIKELFEKYNKNYNIGLFSIAKEILYLCYEIYSENQNDITINKTEITGRLFFELGRFNHLKTEEYYEAEKFYKKSLEVFSNFENKETATYYNFIADFYLKIMNNYDKATELFEKSLKILGMSNNERAETYKILVNIYINKKNYAKAEIFYDEIKKIEELGWGLISINSAKIYYEIAKFHHAKKENHEKAKEFYDKSYEIRKQLKKNEENQETAHFLFDMAEFYNFYCNNKYFDQTELFYKKCLEIQEKIFNTVNKEIATTYDSLARFYVKAKNFVEAEKFYNKIILQHEKKLGEIKIEESYYRFALVYHYDMNNYEKARIYYEKCKTIREKSNLDKINEVQNQLKKLEDDKKKKKKNS